jgi:hypothetical protein
MMRRLFAIVGILVCVPTFSYAQPFGFNPPPGVVIQDEGTAQGRARTLNCTGAGISCTVSSGVATVNVPGGGAGSANVASVTIDFTAAGSNHVKTTVTGQTWVTSSSVVVCSPTGFATADRPDGSEDAAIEGLTVSVSKRVVGTGFDLDVAPANGNALGKYLIHCTGA